MRSKGLPNYPEAQSLTHRNLKKTLIMSAELNQALIAKIAPHWLIPK